MVYAIKGQNGQIQIDEIGMEPASPVSFPFLAIHRNKMNPKTPPRWILFHSWNSTQAGQGDTDKILETARQGNLSVLDITDISYQNLIDNNFSGATILSP